ncbi:MAG: hypothetical protein JXA42_15145, partial [Anaerolineales bacterium]|nr:hypothetical protein [Anaerolineales bacterium]
PLALLGGSVIDRLVGVYLCAVDVQEYKAGFLGSAAALSILFVHIFISLGQYARYIISIDENGLQRANTSLLLVGISIIMIVGVVSLVWTYSRKLAFTSLMAALILFFTFYSLGRSWELGHTHQADPREYWVDDYATAPGAYLLVDTIETISQRTTGVRWDIPLTVQVDDPLLHWLLRDFRDVTWVDALQSTIITEAVITPAEEENPILGDSYLGIDFSLQSKEQLTAEDETEGGILRWLLLRDRSDPAGVNHVVLWIRQDIALTSQE